MIICEILLFIFTCFIFGGIKNHQGWDRSNYRRYRDMESAFQAHMEYNVLRCPGTKSTHFMYALCRYEAANGKNSTKSS